MAANRSWRRVRRERRLRITAIAALFALTPASIWIANNFSPNAKQGRLLLNLILTSEALEKGEYGLAVQKSDAVIEKYASEAASLEEELERKREPLPPGR